MKSTVVAAIYCKNIPVGFVLGTAFVDHEENFKGSVELFKKEKLKPEEYFYISEAIIAKSHRGKKLITKVSTILLNHIIINGYTSICFVTEDHENHPLKPINYQSIDSLCFHFGCKKLLISTSIYWPTIQADGKIQNQAHILRYWTKSLT